MRRQLLVLLTAAALAAGILLTASPLDPGARTPAPAGAVLSVTGPDAGGATPSAGGPEAAGATPSAEILPTPTTATPGSEPVAVAALGRGLVADGPVAPNPTTLTGYRWPLARGWITSPFGPSWYGALLIDGARFHDGIDIASRCGDRVRAAHDGLVVAAGRYFDEWIGWDGDIGPHTRRMNALHLWGALPITVIVDDGNGYRSIYAHFAAITVRAGQRVTAGQLLGYEGRTGKATGCHVHYGLFSPFATGRFRLRPDVAARTRYPHWEIARVDPLLVLPAIPPGSRAEVFPVPGRTISALTEPPSASAPGPGSGQSPGSRR